MKEKSLTWNAFVYIIKILSSIIFPLITFPYISRVLGVEGIGKFNFSNSYISYFSLISALGISTYAIREGAKIRDNQDEFEDFAQDIFLINIWSTIVSIGLLILSIFFYEPVSLYKDIILILSISIPLTTMGTEWVFVVFEDFSYITIRSVLFQLFSMILMFILVNDGTDVKMYAFISVVATAGSNILNFQRASKYFSHKIRYSKSARTRLKPIFILFASSIASQIYINADITMLGILKGDFDTGIYSTASKIYNIVRLLLAAIITILLPRLSNMKGKIGAIKYGEYLSNIYKGFMSLVFLVAGGLFCVSAEAIVILAGEDFLGAKIPLMILCIALVFSLLGSFIANTILIVYSKEKTILLATCVGAITNIFLNIIFINQFSYVGAAMTTLFSEMVVFTMQMKSANENIYIKGIGNDFVKDLVGVGIIFMISSLVNLLEMDFLIKLALKIILCASVYCITMLLLKHSTWVDLFREIMTKIKKSF